MSVQRIAALLRLLGFVCLLPSSYFIVRAGLDFFPAQRAFMGDASTFTPAQNPLGFLRTLHIAVTPSFSVRWWVLIAAIAGFSGACWAASGVLRRERADRVAA
jgi:hypothetical protein